MRSRDAESLSKLKQEFNNLRAEVQRLKPLFSDGTLTQDTRVGVIRQSFGADADKSKKFTPRWG